MADTKLRLRSGTGEIVDIALVDNGDGTHAVATSATGAAAGGGLTNTELRATPVPVSVSGVATAANQATTNTALGAPDDTAAASDTGTSSVIAFIKRALQNWTTLLARIPALSGGRVPVDGSGATQPVSATSLPLPTGAATSAAQATGNTSLSSIDGKLPASLGTKDAAASLSVAVAPAANRSVAAITRPANTTAYTANDVVGGVLTFSNVSPVAGGPIMLTSIDLRYDVASIPSGMTSFRLYLYNATPPSAIADNGAWDLGSGDRSAFIGFVDLGAPADIGSTLFAQVDGVNKQVHCASGSTSLFGYLVTLGGYTPAANSETVQVTLRGVAL